MAKSTFSVANASIFFLFLLFLVLPHSNAGPPVLFGGGLEANSNLFEEYISGNGVSFSDVPINPNVQFHFILAFAVDYTTGGSPNNGKFNIFWNKTTLTPAAVKAIKDRHKNVKVAVSLGGSTVARRKVVFNPTSVSSWVNNSVTSLTKIIKDYHLDGIDIHYEAFGPSGTPQVFADSIGQLISKLKQRRVISFASIAPFDAVQRHYVALWNRHARLINYVNFLFYTYPRNITVPQFIRLFNQKVSLYRGARVIIGFSTKNGTGGLKPDTGFFTAARQLKSRRQLEGIFIWSADASKASRVGFRYESEAQQLLAGRSPNTIFTEVDDDGDVDVDVDVEQEEIFIDSI